MSNTSNPIPPAGGFDTAFGSQPDGVTRDLDDEETLDPDLDDDQISSADADRLAVDPDDDGDDLFGRN